MSCSSSDTTNTRTLSQYISNHRSFRSPRSPSSPLPALYSDLSRQRKSNPAGYRASVEWWKSILLDVTFSGSQLDHNPTSADGPPDRTIFTLNEGTKAAWTVDGVGRPLGLGTVVSELEREQCMVELGRYLRSASAIVGPTGWRQYLTVTGVASALLMPARWAAGSVYSAVVGQSDDDEDEALFRAKKGEWVVYPLVVKMATTFVSQFYAQASSPLSYVMSNAAFERTLSDVCLKQYGWKPGTRDVQVVLKYLSRDTSPRLAVGESGLVKLSPSAHAAVEPITDEDRSVVAVLETLRKLDSQITLLEDQITHRTQQITLALRSNNRTQATSYLASRKALQHVLANRTAVKTNLDQVVAKIEQAKTDVEVIRAYQASQDVLRRVLGSDELKVDNVDKTMDGLHDVMERQREVDEMIKGELQGVDEDEVMDELRVLEREVGEERERAKEKQEKKKQEKEKECEKDKQRAKEAKDDKQHQDLQARLDRLRVTQSPLSTTSSTPETQTDNAAEHNNSSPTAIAEQP